mmetsp:Transcript_59715/g.136474  ORF Transcript_59715/g.136474 Transcript_59715/m.136474 type:complete len:118 (-) Transcript_59715:618-971(-)
MPSSPPAWFSPTSEIRGCKRSGQPQVWNRDNSGGMGVARKIGNLLKDLLGKHLDHHNTMEYKECSSAVKGCKSPDGTKASPWLAAAAAKCPPHLPPPSPTVSPPGLITPRAPGCFLS